jgi:omega-amidase
MKIAAARIASTPGDLEANLRTIKDFASRAKDSGVKLIVFPEMIDTGYSMPLIQKHATSWAEGAVPRLQKMAKQFSLAIIAGVSDRDGSRIHNAQVFIDSGGNIRAKYRKTHLVTAAPLDERPVFAVGDTFTSCKLDKFNLGLTICYDLRFPEVCRASRWNTARMFSLIPPPDHSRALNIYGFSRWRVRLKTNATSFWRIESGQTTALLSVAHPQSSILTV